MDPPVSEADSAEAVGAALVETGAGVETDAGEDVVAELGSGADVDVAVDEDVDPGDTTGARGIGALRTVGWVICGRSCGRS